MQGRRARCTVAGLVIAVGLALAPIHAAPEAHPSLTSEALEPIADVVHQEIASGHIPGAVVLVGQGHEIVYREAFGLRVTQPVSVPMTVDTVFDLASLTKVVATTTAVMQLVEQGRLRLDAPVSTFWPQFAAAGKRTITVRDLLIHYSGLKPDLNLTRAWSGYAAAMRLLAAERPLSPPRTRYVYSDENFEVLGELVRRVSKIPFDQYCEEYIFRPLGMSDTRFRPPRSLWDRIAPTRAARDTQPGARVNDPTSERMGGVAGHAGLFSSADDLAVFARMLLDGGAIDSVRVLSRESVALMTQPASPPSGSHVRGLGWDLAAPLASGGDDREPDSFGHTGFTGTMIWIDPASNSYVIVLTNRTYPTGRGDAQALRKAILALVTSALGS